MSAKKKANQKDLLKEETEKKQKEPSSSKQKKKVEQLLCRNLNVKGQKTKQKKGDRQKSQKNTEQSNIQDRNNAEKDKNGNNLFKDVFNEDDQEQHNQNSIDFENENILDLIKNYTFIKDKSQKSARSSVDAISKSKSSISMGEINTKQNEKQAQNDDQMEVENEDENLKNIKIEYKEVEENRQSSEMEEDEEESEQMTIGNSSNKKLKKIKQIDILQKCNSQQIAILKNVELTTMQVIDNEDDDFQKTEDQALNNKKTNDQDIQEGTENEIDIGELPEFTRKENIRDKNGNQIGSENYDPTTLLIEESQLQKFKPYMREYWRIKSNHYDKIVLIKLGRFYEAYYEDSYVCNQILHPKYSRKYKCGFPEEILFPYLSKLTECNLKVVIVEQLETEKQQKERIKQMKSQNIKLSETDKLMKRDVVAIYTKGTAALQLVRSRKLNLTTSTYMLSIVTEKQAFNKKVIFGLTFFDSITGKILQACFEDDQIYSTFQKLIYLYRPSEIIYRKQSTDIESLRLLSQLPTKPLTTQLNEESVWKPTYAFNHVVDLFGNDNIKENWPKSLYYFSKYEVNPHYALVYSSLSALMFYLKSNLLYEETIPIANYVRIDYENNREISDYDLEQEESMKYEITDQDGKYDDTKMVEEKNIQEKRLVLDSQTLSNLDIIEVSYGTKDSNDLLKQYSLLQLLDRTSFYSGDRLMKRWVASPLVDKQQIEQRLDAIEDLEKHKILRDQFKQELSNLCDLENILSRLYSYRVKNKSRQIIFDSMK